MENIDSRSKKWGVDKNPIGFASNLDPENLKILLSYSDFGNPNPKGVWILYPFEILLDPNPKRVYILEGGCYAQPLLSSQCLALMLAKKLSL